VAMNAGSTGNIAYNSSAGYAVGSITADGTIFAATSGLDATGDTITLTTAAGTVTQAASGDAVLAGDLKLGGTGNYTLVSVNNDVTGNLAGATSGDVKFV